MPLTPGQILNHRYRIKALLGLGGLALAGLVVLAIWGLSAILGSGRDAPTPDSNYEALLMSRAETQQAVETHTAETVASLTAAVVTLTSTPLPASITDTKGVPMALIPGGEFQMGSYNGDDDEMPVHTVYLDAFYMDVYEVSIARYAECVSAMACQPPPDSSSSTRSSYYGNPRYADYPVIRVDWDMAKTYCEWRGGELPTEAQWEKAARGKLQGMEYPWGNEKPVCEKVAQNGANSYDCTTKDPEPVGSYSPNDYGLFDMAGNVWEWVWDWYSDSYYSSQPPLKNPLGPAKSDFKNPFNPANNDFRVIRGGAWDSFLNDLRVAVRNAQSQTYKFDHTIGFRCSHYP
jgi:formylglycine-generating enzyme required for sulfatase activity